MALFDFIRWDTNVLACRLLELVVSVSCEHLIKARPCYLDVLFTTRVTQISFNSDHAAAGSGVKGGVEGGLVCMFGSQTRQILWGRSKSVERTSHGL